MKEGSGWRIVVGFVLVVALIGAAAALAWMAYNAGATQGAAQGTDAPLAVAPYAMYRPHFMAPFGYGFIGCLVPLAFLFLVFGLFRLIVWGGMGRHMMHGGWGMHAGMREHWRERMEELHREMHAAGGGEPPAAKPSA
jgi:hypothetical protein